MNKSSHNFINPFALRTLQRVGAQSGEPIGEATDLKPPEKLRVFVVTWQPNGGVGGFDWFYRRDAAMAQAAEYTADGTEDVLTNEVEVPNLRTTDEITKWLDENWYDR